MGRAVPGERPAANRARPAALQRVRPLPFGSSSPRLPVPDAYPIEVDRIYSPALPVT
jgi:hypothetical protein